MRYRILKDGAEIADLSEYDDLRLGNWSAPRRAVQQGRATLPEGYTVEAYDPPDPEPVPVDPKAVVLGPAEFFFAVDNLAGLTPADPEPDLWMQQQIKASAVLTQQQKRAALIYVRKAGSFQRSHELMDSLAQAILGITPEALDQAFVAAASQSDAP